MRASPYLDLSLKCINICHYISKLYSHLYVISSIISDFIYTLQACNTKEIAQKKYFYWQIPFFDPVSYFRHVACSVQQIWKQSNTQRIRCKVRQVRYAFHIAISKNNKFLMLFKHSVLIVKDRDNNLIHTEHFSVRSREQVQVFARCSTAILKN